LQIPEEHGVLRVLDGQHRLLALHSLSQTGDAMGIEVPAVLFDSLDARQIVELFVTINAKHTRLNPSHIISLAGRKLYPDPNQALAHDAIRALIRAAPDVMARAKELKREPFDLNGIREAIKPWGERLRDRRFETEGEWKLKLAGGTRGTVEVLTRELRDALR